MTATIDHPEVIASLPPCPAWCDGGGEGFDENRRNHELLIGGVMGVDLDRPDDDCGAAVTLQQTDKIVGRDVHRGQVQLTLLFGDSMVAFEPKPARQLAEALVRAADRAEEVQSS